MHFETWSGTSRFKYSMFKFFEDLRCLVIFPGKLKWRIQIPGDSMCARCLEMLEFRVICLGI